MRAHPGLACVIGAIVLVAFYGIGWWWVGGLEGVFLPFTSPADALIFWLLAIAWGGLAARAIGARRWLATGAGAALILLAASPGALVAFSFKPCDERGACL